MREYITPLRGFFAAVVVLIALPSLYALFLPIFSTDTAGSSTPNMPTPQIILDPVLLTPLPTTTPPAMYNYLEIVDGCGPYFEGTCVNVRAGPGTDYPVVSKLRTGVVLRVSGSEQREGRWWHKIEFVHPLLYPERVSGDWYVSADASALFSDDGDHRLVKGAATTSKRILVDKSDEMLYAYEGDNLYMKEAISTGLDGTPTPAGTFSIFLMTPSRFMQGPLPGVSDQAYDLPGVPWNLYFTSGGAVIHGAYWHNHFGQPWSHGCVNLPPQKAKQLYLWADIGTPVTVRE